MITTKQNEKQLRNSGRWFWRFRKTRNNWREHQWILLLGYLSAVFNTRRKGLKH